jgi:hypothetical protein
MITTMGKTVLTITVSILVVGVRAIDNKGLRFSSTPHMSTMKQGLSTEFGNLDKKLTTLYKHVQSLNNRVSLHEEETKAKFSGFESKYAELFACVSVEEGKHVVLKEGCHLVLRKGKHKVEGELHVLGSHIIDGGNLHVHDGTGTHDCSYGSSSNMKKRCNGLGNIIIGHSPQASEKHHHVLSGSHNIILGTSHSVSSHGGLVSGVGHNVLGEHASAIAGTDNTAAGEGSVVLGGSSNLSGSIVGNVGTGKNKATGSHATVTGGSSNKASGNGSSVSGGIHNTASGHNSSISGGSSNKASGNRSSVSGGSECTASGFYSSVSGGHLNTAKGIVSWVSGGQKNNANADYSSIVDFRW